MLYISGYLDPLLGIGDRRPEPDRLITKPFSAAGLLAGIRHARRARRHGSRGIGPEGTERAGARRGSGPRLVGNATHPAGQAADRVLRPVGSTAPVPGTGALPRAIERRARRGKNHKIGARRGDRLFAPPLSSELKAQQRLTS